MARALRLCSGVGRNFIAEMLAHFASRIEMVLEFLLVNVPILE